jgi:hypothetical protein
MTTIDSRPPTRTKASETALRDQALVDVIAVPVELSAAN